MKLKKGLVHIYTGDGKGKSTAAIGQGIRSAGNGLEVIMIQFLKSSETGELEILRKIENFNVFRFERPRGFFWNLSESEKLELKEDIDKAVDFIASVIENNSCDVLILDEILGVLSNQLLEIDRLFELLNKKPESMEVILTGRDAPIELIEYADYVSEIKFVKHPFSKGIPSRKGIEY